VRQDYDVVVARQRARTIAALLGYENQDQVKFATAVSEIARNACRYAEGGHVTFYVAATSSHDTTPCDDPAAPAPGSRADRTWWLMARIADTGCGIAHIDDVMSGTYVSQTGMGLGIVGAKKLNDCFRLETAVNEGTTVELGRRFPRSRRSFSGTDAADIGARLAAIEPGSPMEELERQNQEILETLAAVRERQTAVERLNAELAETNRGVLALYAELDDRAQELKRISEYKTRFLSDISHELRTPLTSMMNLSRILLDRIDGDLAPEQERQVAMIRNAAQGLADMVNELLDIARIEAGKTVIRPAQFAASDLFASLRALMRPLMVSDAVKLIVDEESAARIPAMFTDEVRLSQILRNFLSNAIKFTERGAVSLYAQSEDDDKVRFVVADTGVGIASEDITRIFDAFTQVDGPIQRRVKGSGLGLPLTRKLAALLGGTVEASSTVGMGSVFSVTIPRNYSDANSETGQTADE
jgi:signal transduction histidine kinase